MTVYIAFGTASVGKALFLALFEHADGVELAGHSRDADQAIEQIRREKPELVIVEEILTLGWGMDVVQSIEPGDGAPAVVMVSTMPPPNVPEEFRCRGIDIWLQLPEATEKLHKTLDTLLKGDCGTSIVSWRQQLAEERAKG
jgi:DNA-binding NarL/FixJ family response regulator